MVGSDRYNGKSVFQAKGGNFNFFFKYVSYILQKLKKSQNQLKRKLKKKRLSKTQSVVLHIEFTLDKYAVFKNT